MHIITRARLRDFWEEHPDAKAPLAAWYQIVRRTRYTRPADLRRDFPSASFIGDETVVFNIGGGKYRLVVAMVYATGMVYIKRVGTHAEYDRWTH
jgi:mRNA interferase HigB